VIALDCVQFLDKRDQAGRQFFRHRITFSKVSPDTSSGEPPSKWLIACGTRWHPWARSLAPSRNIWEIGELKACSRSLCDAPIDMRLCEEKGQICANRLTDPYFSKPCANRYFIFLNSLANSAHFKEPNVRSMAVSETAAVLLRFLSNVFYQTKLSFL
jgi:hypothetical protein